MPHSSSTRTSTWATERPSATRDTRLGLTWNFAGTPVTWTAIESQRSAPQEFFIATRR